MIAFLRKWSHILILLGGMAIAVGILSAYFLPERWRTAAALAQNPQKITLYELAANGVGDNPHVIVTDFICGSEYIFEAQIRKGAPLPKSDETVWGKAWIPLLPKSSPDVRKGDSPPSFTVLLETTPTVTSVSGFHLLSRRQSMEGLVIPLAQRPLPAEAQSKLAETYPHTDFKNFLVLVQYERHEKEDAPVFAYALAISAGGGLLIGAPLLLLGIMLLRSK